MLLLEVKGFFERITQFFLEVSKLVEFTLDTSANTLIGTIGEEVDLMLTRPKYSLKPKSVKGVNILVF